MFNDAPLYVQKIILYLLQRGNKAFNLNLGGLFVIWMESYASVNVVFIKMIFNIKFINV